MDNRELNRDLQREFEGVEAPLFADKFQEWLRANGKSESTIVNYLRWLRKADSWIVESDCDHDFWTLLTRAWKASDFGTIEKLCKGYENLIVIEKTAAEKDSEYGESVKEISNWLSSFRAYKKFIEEQMENAEDEKRALAVRIESSRQTASTLLFANQFIWWGIAEGKSEDTMESYVSYIKRINRDLFCKTGYDLLHDFLPKYVKTKNTEKIEEMFSAMDAKLTERIDTENETEMSVKNLENNRSALRSYAKFIKSILNK